MCSFVLHTSNMWDLCTRAQPRCGALHIFDRIPEHVSFEELLQAVLSSGSNKPTRFVPEAAKAKSAMLRICNQAHPTASLSCLCG